MFFIKPPSKLTALKKLDTIWEQSNKCSIFPEKNVFDGKKCRTTRINDVLRFILQIDKGLDKNKSGQLSNKIELSTLVESGRVELPSKQATKKLSTRLFPDWVFDSELGQEQPLFA